MNKKLLLLGVVGVVIILSSNVSALWWANNTYSNRKNSSIMTYTNDEFIFLILGNDTDINSSTGYPMALRIIAGENTEIPYANGTDDASGVWGLWIQQNGSARNQTYSIYYGASGVEYPDYSGSTPFTYDVSESLKGKLFNFYDSFEDNNLDEWSTGYADGAKATISSEESMDGIYAGYFNGISTLSRKIGVSSTDIFYAVFFSYREAGEESDEMTGFWSGNTVIQDGVIWTGGYPTVDEWGYDGDGSYTTTGISVSKSAWDKHFLIIDNDNDNWSYRINDILGVSNLGFDGGLPYINISEFHTWVGDDLHWIDLIIVSRNNFNTSVTRPIIGALGAEESSIEAEPPSCSCIQFPVDLSFSHFGSNVTWTCNCSGDNLNHSSFMWLHGLESYGSKNWSYRPPDNLMSDEERRACRRYNKTLYPQYAYWYEYITDLPQLTQDIYTWGVHDYQSAKVDLIYSSSNRSNYSVTALFDHLIISEWDLNRIFLQSEYKVNDFERVYKNRLGAKKFTKGSCRVNATYSCYINLESQGSNQFTSVYHCNESLVLLHEADPMSKDYCHFINSFQDSVYAYSVRNSSYVDDFQFKVNASGFINGLEADSTYYILVALSENSITKATKWHYADAKNITGDGVGFDNINRSFYSTDNGDSWVTGNYSFDIVCRYAHPDNDSLNWFVYLCDNDSSCFNSSVTVDVLGIFNNSLPNVQVISPDVGESVSGLYNFSWVANDPDGDVLNFSGFLFYSNGSLHSTLFSDSFNYSFLWNSSSVGDGSWIFNVTAFDPYSNSSSAHSFLVNNLIDMGIMFWVFDVLGSPIPDVFFTVRNASTNVSLWSNSSDASGYVLYPSDVYEELFIYLDFPTYSAVLSNISGDPVVHINDWVTGRVRLSNSLGAFLEDQDCSVVVYDSASVLIHDYDTRCRAGSSFVDRHGNWVSIGNCSLSDSGGWYYFKGRVDESMGFVYDESYDLIFTCNGQTANFSFTTSFEKTPLDMSKTEDFIRNYSGLFIVYGVFGFLCLLTLIIIILILFSIKKN